MPGWLRFAVGFWLAAAFVVWNGFFEMFVGRGERDYLIAQANHDLGLGPGVVMDAMMAASVREATIKATIWGVLVFAAGVGACVQVRRLTRREIGASRPPA
jgi:hypothetical protein